MSTTVRILKTPDVLHGKPRIEGALVGVFQIGTLVREREWSVADAAAQFDTVRDTLAVDALGAILLAVEALVTSGIHLRLTR